MPRTLLLLVIALLPTLYSCAGDPVEEKEEEGHAVDVRAGLKRRSPILRPRGFTQFRELRRSNFLVPVAFFEADSVLRISNSGKASPTSPEDVYVLPCVAPRLAQLVNDGYYVAIISNQPEIGKKTANAEQVDKTLFATVQAVDRQGGAIDYFDYADQDDEFLKPQTGMGARLERFLEANYNPSYKIDHRRSFIVGKAVAVDRQFAENYFGPSMPWQPHYFDAGTFFGWKRRDNKDSFSSVADAKKFAGLKDACCDVSHSCAGDGKSSPKGYNPPVYQYPVND